MNDHHLADVTGSVPQGPDPLGLPFLLGEVAPGRDLAGMPVTTPDGDTVVVLDYDPGDVALAEVWSLRDVTRVLPTRTPVTPDGQAIAPLRRALAHLVETVRTLRIDRTVDQAHHQRRSAAIRTYAIDRHLDGDFCRSGLNDFLTRFDLPPYQPRYTVNYTITGSYEVEATPENDEDAVRRDAEQAVQLDLDRVPRLIDGSESCDVSIDVITLDDYQATPLT